MGDYEQCIESEGLDGVQEKSSSQMRKMAHSRAEWKKLTEANALTLRCIILPTFSPS